MPEGPRGHAGEVGEVLDDQDAASVGWYRAATIPECFGLKPPARSGRIATPLTALWPALDPLFPIAWSDRLEEYFSDVTFERLGGVGHFLPLVAPDIFASAIRRRLA